MISLVGVHEGKHNELQMQISCFQEQKHFLRDDFYNFIVNFPFICGNIPSAPVYEFFISQFIRYATAYRNYAELWYCPRLLTIMILEQGYDAAR